MRRLLLRPEYKRDTYGADTRRCCVENIRCYLNGVFCAALFILAFVAALYLFSLEGLAARAMGF